MIIRLIVLAALGIFLLYGLASRSRSPYIGLAMIIIAVIGAALVLFPQLTQIAADAVGVGRGVDLMFYLFILVMLMMILNLHLRMRSIDETITKLTREIALQSARVPEGREARP